MDRVAEPAPSFALTTSSPPNWTPVIRVSRLGEVHYFPHTIDQSIKLVFWNLDAGLSLTEERNNCLSRVTSNHWNDSSSWISVARNFLDKCLSSNNIQRGNTKELLGIK